MNIEICKKCKGTENLTFRYGFDINSKNQTVMSIRCYFDFDSSDKKYNLCQSCIYISLNKKYRNQIRKIIGKSNSYVATFMEIDKRCPYYVEHQLTEWNKK